MADKELNEFLIKAIKNNDLSTVQEALDAGADLNWQAGYMRRTPLHYAVFDESGEILRELLKRGAKTDLFDDSGFTPLHEAVIIGQFINAEILLEHGADINAQEGKSVTPLHAAYFSDMKSETSLRVGFLLENGADQSKTMLWGGDEKTALQIAEETRNPHANRLAGEFRKYLKKPVSKREPLKPDNLLEGVQEHVANDLRALRERARPHKTRFQLKK